MSSCTSEETSAALRTSPSPPALTPSSLLSSRRTNCDIVGYDLSKSLKPAVAALPSFPSDERHRDIAATSSTHQSCSTVYPPGGVRVLFVDACDRGRLLMPDSIVVTCQTTDTVRQLAKSALRTFCARLPPGMDSRASKHAISVKQVAVLPPPPAARPEDDGPMVRMGDDEACVAVADRDAVTLCHSDLVSHVVRSGERVLLVVAFPPAPPPTPEVPTDQLMSAALPVESRTRVGDAEDMTEVAAPRATRGYPTSFSIARKRHRDATVLLPQARSVSVSDVEWQTMSSSDRLTLQRAVAMRILAASIRHV